MTTRTITISEALDMAVAKLPPLRRSVMKMRLRSDGFRTRTLAELRLKLSDDTDCCALLGDSFGAGLADETFGDATPFAIDIDKLDQFLQLILKYLPQILEIIFKLFAVITFVALSLAMGSSANAQMVCANGQCKLLRATAAVAAVPVQVATYPLRYAANQGGNYASVSSRSGYGSGGSQVVQGYGSQGSAQATGRRWRLFDRIRSLASERQSSGYGCSGSQVPMAAPNCTCSPCTCAPAAPAAPVAPELTFRAPAIALPPDSPLELYAVASYPK